MLPFFITLNVIECFRGFQTVMVEEDKAGVVYEVVVCLWHA